MASVTAKAFQLLLSSTLLVISLGCDPPGNDPLLLTPYLERQEPHVARNLSQVDKSCLKDFVPPSHTGFLTVDKKLGNHLFFWFFPCSGNENAPLLLWLNGGPTGSSLIGLFHEHGPMDIKAYDRWNPRCDDEGGYGRVYTERKFPWTKNFSMLYVDNPVNVGFSFSDSGEAGDRVTQEGYTNDMVSFLKQFLQIFPEYRSREIYLGGQSYAGKFIVPLGHKLHVERMNNVSDAIHFTGIYLGAPLLDPEIQNGALYDYVYNAGIVSHQGLVDAQKRTQDFYDLAAIRNPNTTEMYDYVQATFVIPFTGSLFNIVTRYNGPYLEIFVLMNDTRMKSAAHAGNRSFVGIIQNRKLFAKYYPDNFLVSVKSELAVLMDHYKVLIYTGVYDLRVSPSMVEAVLHKTAWKHQAEYNSSLRSVWNAGRGGKIAGYHSHVGQFCRVNVMDAGHVTPTDAPEVTLIMMEQFIYDGCVSDRVIEDELNCPDGSSWPRNDIVLTTSMFMAVVASYFLI